MKKTVSLLVGLALLAPACQTGETASSGITTVKIGAILPMSGDAAAYGEETKNVLDYALPLLNERMAAQGYEFEIVFEDGGCNGSQAANALQKLHDVDGIEFIFGGLCSAESLGIAPLLLENDMFALSSLSSSPELTDISPRYKSFSYSDNSVGIATAELLNQYDRVGVIIEQADWSLAFGNTVVENLDDDTELVLNLSYQEGATNVRNELQQLKAEDLDAVFFSPNIGNSTTMARQIAELGEWDVTKVSQISMLSDEVLALDTDLLNGMIIVDSPRPDDEAFLAIVDEIIATQGAVSNLGNYYVAAVLEGINQLADQIVANDSDVEAVAKAFDTETMPGYFLAETVAFDGETFVKGMGTATFVIQDGSYSPLAQ